MMRTVTLFLPFFSDPDNVGSIRAHRIVKWFHNSSWNTTIIRSGQSFKISEIENGKIITIEDPFNLFKNDDQKFTNTHVQRKPNALRRFLAYLIFVPDLSIIWAKNVISSKTVMDEIKNTSLMFASSPPESSHIIGLHFKKKYNCNFWIDMRDGWLDEPMKPLLRKYHFQRLREKRLERKCLKAADIISVTSDKWQEMLINRYPKHKSKINILENAIPSINFNENGEGKSNILKFIYAGKLSSSRPERNCLDILTPFINLLNSNKNYPTSEILFKGNFTSDEIINIDNFAKVNSSEKVNFKVESQISRDAILNEMHHSAGLIIISPSIGCIPAKFFDYLATNRPILIFTLKDSALANAAKKTNQCFTILNVMERDEVQIQITHFIESSMNSNKFPIPCCFTESENYNTFNRILKYFG